MKTLQKAAVIAICLLIAQTVLMAGPEQASPLGDQCIVSTANTPITTNIFKADIPTGSNSCTVTGSLTSGGSPTLLTITTSGTQFYPGTGNSWTFYFSDVTINSYTLNPPPPTYRTSNLQNRTQVFLKSNLELAGTYENVPYSSTTIPYPLHLKATTILVDQFSTIYLKGVPPNAGKLIYGSLTNGGTIHIGDDPIGAIVEGDFSNWAYYDKSHFGGTLWFDVAGPNPCPMGRVCGPGSYSVLYVIPSTGKFRDVTGNGTAMLSSKLVMNFVDGYTPLSTDKFHLISAKTVTGHFDSLVVLVDGGTPLAGFPSLSLKNVVFDQSDKKLVPSTSNGIIKEIQASLRPTIAGLPKDEFKHADMKNALLKKLDEVVADIDAGNYADALDKLQNDILVKTDGCANSRSPDNNDWIINCSSQKLVYPLILKVIPNLRSLL